jgi:phosphonate transport system permease protein
MTAVADHAGPAPEALAGVLRAMRRRRLVALSVPVFLVVYLAYVFVAFDVASLLREARWDNAEILLRDSYSHKVHVTQARGDATVVAVEGHRRGTYAPEALPDWVTIEADGTTRIELPRGHAVAYLPDGRVTYDHPDWGLIEIRRGPEGLSTNIAGEPPDWISASATRVALTTEAGRLTVTRNTAETFRYFWGWPLFFFTVESPYYGQPLGAILWGPQLDPARSNLAGAWADFWGNPMWRHGDVAWAIGETALMAFLGTAGAAMLALPLAFAAARNVTPLTPLRFLIRRVFDFLRGVDALIWTIALSRAFGPGPLTGTIAIILTDAGTFGKLFSEAIENMDERQVEGVASTGAPLVARWRFGVIPQLVPVFASQILYAFESNVRSSTIIGAITGGGIGLMLTQAMQTQNDWEDVTYYVILIVLMVFALDALSGRLRRRIITGKAP